MPDVVDTDNLIQGMLSQNSETPTGEAGNSWKEAILNEIGILLNFKVFDVISWEEVPTSERVWQIVVNLFTKRTNDNTPNTQTHNFF